MGEDRNIKAAPWDDNPSSWKARLPICLLAGVAFLISCYLSLYQLRLIPTVWDPVFGAGTQHVLDSPVSEKLRQVLHLPDALLGALAYLGDIILGLAGSTDRWYTRPWLVFVYGLDVILVSLVSMILVGLQGTVVGSWCFLCLITALISLSLVALSYDEVWSSLVFLYRIWTRTKSWHEVWKAFWGNASALAVNIVASGGRKLHVASRH